MWLPDTDKEGSHFYPHSHLLRQGFPHSYSNFFGYVKCSLPLPRALFTARGLAFSTFLPSCTEMNSLCAGMTWGLALHFVLNTPKINTLRDTSWPVFMIVTSQEEEMGRTGRRDNTNHGMTEVVMKWKYCECPTSRQESCAWAFPLLVLSSSPKRKPRLANANILPGGKWQWSGFNPHDTGELTCARNILRRYNLSKP